MDKNKEKKEKLRKAQVSKKNKDQLLAKKKKQDLVVASKKKKILIEKPTDKIVHQENEKESSDEDSSDFDENLGFDYQQVKNWKNKQRTMVVSSRGIKAVERHLMLDLMSLLPHSKTENKIEKRDLAMQIQELCKSSSCQNVLFFEQRKNGKNLYLWMGKSPNGPSVKFKVENIHTSRELKMIGNCQKYSRPMQSFDNSFDEEPQLKLLKEILVDAFNAPKNHPKTKPFVDHVFNFCWVDGRIWFRNYQVFRESTNDKASDDYEQIEIGPRFALCPIKIFAEFLGGEVLYANPAYVAPRMQSRQRKKELEQKFLDKEKRKSRKEDLLQSILPTDDIDKLYDDENFDDLKKKNGAGDEDDDSDMYEEDDADYDE